jgi:carbon starvation protein CstA
MISFLLCLAILIVGYFVYGKIVDNTFGPDDRETPAVRINDGVDYVVMPQWKLFLVQLLNIAGLGPIFGAMQGALWGPVVFLWITFGTIFAGGVHDYFSGRFCRMENWLHRSYTWMRRFGFVCQRRPLSSPPGSWKSPCRTSI